MELAQEYRAKLLDSVAEPGRRHHDDGISRARNVPTDMIRAALRKGDH